MERTFYGMFLSVCVVALSVTAASGAQDNPQRYSSGTRAMEQQVAQNPPPGTTKVQKAEYSIGIVVGVANVCGDTKKANEISMLMRKSPYFKKGYGDTLMYDQITGGCGKMNELMDTVIKDKLQWEMYLDATYPTK